MDESCRIQAQSPSCIKARNRWINLLRNKSPTFWGHIRARNLEKRREYDRMKAREYRAKKKAQEAAAAPAQ